MNGLFPEDSAERKTYPVYSGLVQYFPAAMAAVARHSYLGNEKHNPGQSLHHDRAKSGDEADALLRHLMEADYVGMAWRALSLLQKHLEAQGAPIAPAARNVAAIAAQDALVALDETPAPTLSPEIAALQAHIDAHDAERDLRLRAGEAMEQAP